MQLSIPDFQYLTLIHPKTALPIAEPNKRKERPMLTGEIPSFIRAAGDEPTLVTRREVGRGHFVADEGGRNKCKTCKPRVSLL
jgi:hypothetical protein